MGGAPACPKEADEGLAGLSLRLALGLGQQAGLWRSGQ